MPSASWSHAKSRLLFGSGFRKILVVVKQTAYEVSGEVHFVAVCLVLCTATTAAVTAALLLLAIVCLGS